ncbi:MAG: hypothetical protein LBE85_09935, partial [Candidatus Accumulibacter sp.]|nr:hypothetical protein [Accumulibacter sp.]
MKVGGDQTQADKPRSLQGVALPVLLDLAGMVWFAVGVLWVFDGSGIISGFPANAPVAVIFLADGFLRMAAAARRRPPPPIL